MGWTQAGRPFRLETVLGPDALMVVSWEGEERLSSLFHFVITAVSENPALPAADLLLQKATLHLRLPDGTDRSIHGIIARITRGGVAPQGLTGYVVELVPPHWTLDLDLGFAIYQKKSVRQIVDDLLGAAPHEWKLVRTLEPRPYCFRYRESRFTCVSRLLEQEGIWYRFDHQGGAAKMVIGDKSESAANAWGVSALEYRLTENPSDLANATLSAFESEARPYTGKSRLRSTNEFLFGKDVAQEVANKGGLHPPLNAVVYDFEQQTGAHRTGIDHGGGETASEVAKVSTDLKDRARWRQELLEAQALRYRGRSSYTGLEAGAKTAVKGLPTDLPHDLLIVAVQHAGSNGSYFAGDASAATYENRFEAMPADQPFRPTRVTPWPRVGGSHVGTVVGPAGEEIYTDKQGRVQVVFKWDEDNATTLEHSCWIRVAQPFAGNNFGAVFLPRIGHEVLVEFLDGNPDNPIVVGSLYNNANLPPWPLPANKTQSGIRTKSSLKGGAEDFNELRFEDKKGEELVYLQAQKDRETLVKNDERRTVKRDRTTTIQRHDTRTVKDGNDTVTVEKGEQLITVKDNNRKLTVAKDHTVKVDGNESITVAVDRKVTVKGKQDHAITGDDTTDVKGKRTATVVGDETLTVKTGNQSMTVDTGNVSTTAKVGNITVKANAGAITLQAMQKIELKVGGSSIVIDMKGVTIKGPMVTVEGQAMLQLKAPITQVNANAMLMMKGSITMIN